MDYYLSSKLGERLSGSKCYFTSVYCISFLFLDAYAYSTEGLVGFYRRKNKRTFLTVVQNSIQISFFTALIISLLY